MVKFLAAVAAGTFLVSASVLPAEAFKIDGVVTPINHYFSSSFVSGGFSNAYTFSLGQTSSVHASFSGNPGDSLSLSDFGIFSGSPTAAYTEETATFKTQNVFDSLTAGTSSVTLGAGSYFIGVIGTSKSSTGTYDGTLSVSAVPLPSAVALFGLAVMSLGAVGALRGRSQAKRMAPATL